MRIDPKIEKPTREMMGYAIRGEIQDLATTIQAAGDEVYAGSLALCITAAGYIAVDVTGMRWPDDANLRKIAHNVATAETQLELREADIHAYLSRSVLGSERLEDVFPLVESAYSLPILITASMLFTFRPQSQKWWEYLDAIWAATETALAVDLSVLPALMFRARRQPVLESR
jgi:hypothetical protein